MKDKPEVKIIVATHKPCEMPDDEIYLPLHVGAEGKVDETGKPLDLGIQKDNTGENISELNWCFGTQTALYWAWKNLDVDYTGLAHYRRFFTERRPGKGEDPLTCILSGETLYPLLRRYKVLLPRKRHYYIETVYSHYSHTINGGREQLDIVRSIIDEKCPEYSPSFAKVMKQRSAHIFNMMIMEKSLFDDYCSWLFEILFDLFEKFDTTGMNDFDKRYAGRVSERLLNVWIDRQIQTGVISKKEIKELPYSESVNWKNKVVSFIKAKVFHKKYGASF